MDWVRKPFHAIDVCSGIGHQDIDVTENAKEAQLSWAAQIQSWLWVCHMKTVWVTAAGTSTEPKKMMTVGIDEQSAQGWGLLRLHVE